MKFLFFQKMKVVKCTQRGQVTLPKKWRDEVGTDHFLVIVSDEGVTFKPILKKEFVESVEAAWQDYLENGETISQEEMEKKYGL